MSAPLRDPLVINTQDNRCWVRRAWAQDGRGLYGLEGSPQDAEQTLFLMRELAAYGLRSMTDVLPVPVGSPAEENVTPQVRKLRSLLAGQREAVDGEHYAAVHHTYRVPRDLPPLDGASC